MPPNIRLTACHRTKLLAFARSLVDTSEFDAAIATAAADVDRTARAAMDQQWPMVDMVVLKRYGLTASNHSVVIAAESAQNKRIGAPLIEEQPMPYHPNVTLVLPDEHALFSLVTKLRSVEADKTKYIKEATAPYARLIDSSRTMAQVLAVWPEAEGAGIGGTTALVALSDEDKARIADDMAARKASEPSA